MLFEMKTDDPVLAAILKDAGPELIKRAYPDAEMVIGGGEVEGSGFEPCGENCGCAAEAETGDMDYTIASGTSLDGLIKAMAVDLAGSKSINDRRAVASLARSTEGMVGVLSVLARLVDVTVVGNEA